MIAFDRQGKGAPVVLVHGITESRRSWDPLVPALSAAYDVLRVDLRGHGESEVTPPFDIVTMATDVHEVVEAAGMAPPLVIGHSLGAMVVTAYASLFPCRGVINVDQSLDLAGFQEGLRKLAPLLEDPATFPAALDAVLSGTRGALPDAEWERLESLRRPERDVVLAIWAPVIELSPQDLAQMAQAFAAGVTVPYLALHGSDPGSAYRDWLTSLMVGAEIEFWDGLGHYPHLAEQRLFVDRVVAFGAGLSR
jgi:pimeloyl-ACP methyl ester carboxylesterase